MLDNDLSRGEVDSVYWKVVNSITDFCQLGKPKLFPEISKYLEEQEHLQNHLGWYPWVYRVF